ncbi:MAG: hypothetical protein ACI8TP_001438 [Acidimicrobiales bacterium]|jgi:single-strand DNA-binding protein
MKNNKASGEETNTGGHLNWVVLAGEVRATPQQKVLPSGDHLMSFDLRVPSSEGPRQSIPVSWIGKATKVPRIEGGADVVVIGEIRRRFYRGASGLASRIDVRASRVVAGGQAQRRRALEAQSRRFPRAA